MLYVTEPNRCANCGVTTDPKNPQSRMTLVEVLDGTETKRGWICGVCGETHLKYQPPDPQTATVQIPDPRPDPRPNQRLAPTPPVPAESPLPAVLPGQQRTDLDALDVLFRDTVCYCGHWYEEHFDNSDPAHPRASECDGCADTPSFDPRDPQNNHLTLPELHAYEIASRERTLAASRLEHPHQDRFGRCTQFQFWPAHNTPNWIDESPYSIDGHDDGCQCASCLHRRWTEVRIQAQAALTPPPCQHEPDDDTVHTTSLVIKPGSSTTQTWCQVRCVKCSSLGRFLLRASAPLVILWS